MKGYLIHIKFCKTQVFKKTFLTMAPKVSQMCYLLPTCSTNMTWLYWSIIQLQCFFLVAKNQWP